MVTQPTRRKEKQRANILDLVLVNDEQLISDISHLSPFGKSDHDTLYFDLYVSIGENKSTGENSQVSKFNLKKANFDERKKSWQILTGLH